MLNYQRVLIQIIRFCMFFESPLVDLFFFWHSTVRGCQGWDVAQRWQVNKDDEAEIFFCLPKSPLSPLGSWHPQGCIKTETPKDVRKWLRFIEMAIRHEQINYTRIFASHMSNYGHATGFVNRLRQTWFNDLHSLLSVLTFSGRNLCVGSLKEL